MKSFSIVVATAVRPSLIETLNCINNSTLKPEEVIISIPKGKFLNIKKNFKFKLRVLAKEIGQVSQRIEGFKMVQTDLCIQMDDDILFDKNFLEIFISRFNKLPRNSVLAPLHGTDKEILSLLVSPKIYFSNILYFILDSQLSPKYGSITKAGFPIGVNPFYNSKIDNPLVKTEWINGCCIIHNNENLIKNWEHPFKGKAYAEDLLHSKYLMRNGISLFIDRSLKINLQEEKKLNLFNFIYTYFKARIISFKVINYLESSRYSLPRYASFTVIYLILRLLSLLINYLKNKLKSKI